MSIGIPPCITLNFTIIMEEKEHDGRHKGRLRRKAYETGPSLAKATCGSWLKKWKATVTPDPNRPLRGNGSELHSPSHMSLGLSLRFKSVLRNSGRIYLAAARMETSPHSSSTTERARLPHFNEATCGFRSPALAGRIDSTSRVPRRKDPTGTVRCRSTEPKEKNKKVSLTPNQSAFSG